MSRLLFKLFTVDPVIPLGNHMIKLHADYLKFNSGKFTVTAAIFFPFLTEAALSSFYNAVDKI